MESQSASPPNCDQPRAKLAEDAKMTENEISKIVIEEALRLHRARGPGLLETVDEVVLADALRERGLEVVRQIPIPIVVNGKRFDEGFRADLLVNAKVLIELKSIERLAPVHKKQVVTYLRLMGLKLGLLINFGGELLKGNVERLVNRLEEPRAKPAKDATPGEPDF